MRPRPNSGGPQRACLILLRAMTFCHGIALSWAERSRQFPRRAHIELSAQYTSMTVVECLHFTITYTGRSKSNPDTDLDFQTAANPYRFKTNCNFGRNDPRPHLVALHSQKIVAFENAFERLLHIVSVEGNSDGGIIVEDCLSLLINLLRSNLSNQNFFRETRFVNCIGLPTVIPHSPGLYTFEFLRQWLHQASSTSSNSSGCVFFQKI